MAKDEILTKRVQRLRMEVKEVSAEGAFEGMLSPYGNVDLGGDVVLQGAYTKTLQEQGNTRPLLWQHKADTPIGELTLEDRPEGLWCRGQLLMTLPDAQKAYLLMKARIVRGLSIGFESVKDMIDSGVRKLKEIKLYEGSVVTFPMNEAALIASVKRRATKQGEDFNDELTERQLLDGGYQMECALGSALRGLTWATELSRDEKIAAAEVIIGQFHDAYMTYLPEYLDLLTEEYGAMETWSQEKFQTKAGRKISAGTKEAIMAACDQIASGHKSLLALIDDEAVDDSEDTYDSKAAGKEKPEPAPDHSAEESLIRQMRSLFGG